jgi:Flp pilus assembly protein TadG
LKVRMNPLPRRVVFRFTTPAALLRDRRGVTTMTFVILGFVMLGFTALCTEVGGWYLAQGAAQIAADSAAVAAAIAASGDPAAAEGAATASANGNGYTAVTTGQIVLRTGTPATQVTIKVPLTPLIAAFFLGTNAITVTATSVASQTQIGTACVLSTASDLTINQVQYSPDCSYASNATTPTAISISNSVDTSTFNPFGYVSAGDCPTCPSNPFGRPPASYQPKIADPYVSTLATGPASSGAVNCLTTAGTGTNYLVPAVGIAGNTSYPLAPSGPYYAYCNADVVIPSATRVILSPGVYLFFDSTLTVQNGATVECQMPPTSTSNTSQTSARNPACDPGGQIQGTGVTLAFSGTSAQNSTSGDGCDQSLTGGVSAVTLVFAGPQPTTTNATQPYATFTASAPTPPSGPSVKICPGAAVQLSPPSSSDSNTTQNFYAPFVTNGVLIWRDPSMATGNAGAPAVDIESQNPGSLPALTQFMAPAYTAMNGLLYFPNATVTYGANGLINGSPPMACSTLVAATINLSNFPSSFQDCNNPIYGFQTPQGLPTTPQVLSVRVVQ